jgi:hypothetical protein
MSYYVRCNTRSSGATSKGTAAQALDYITDAHDSERDPSFSNPELRYIARLDPGWKQDLEGGRLPLIGLGALHGCTDQAKLAHDFQEACQPYHDRRGTTGYLSYTFTLPKEISLVAEGNPRKAREAIYAALQKTLETTFPGKDVSAVTTVHVRNQAGEVHYHAHVLIGKFAYDRERKRPYSLNSASGGNTGKERLSRLKGAWKEHVDIELKSRLGLTITQPTSNARPALTLADGTYIPPLNQDSRRMLEKHLKFRLSTTSPAGLATTKNFKWTHFDPTIYELAAGKRGRGWDPAAFKRLFPKQAPRLKTYESRVATLKRIGYLTPEGHVTEAFTLHYRAKKGDHPELQRIRADLHKLSRRGSKPGGPSGGGGATAPSTAQEPGLDADEHSVRTAAELPAGEPLSASPDVEAVEWAVGEKPGDSLPTALEAGDVTESAAEPAEPDRDDYPISDDFEPPADAAPPADQPAPDEPDRDDFPIPDDPGAGDDGPPPDEPGDPGEEEDVELWLALHRHQRMIQRLDRLGVSPADFKKFNEQARRAQPTPETLRRLRAEAKRETALTLRTPPAPKTKGIVRAYCAIHRAKVVSVFVVAKGLVTLRLGHHLALAEQMRKRARIDFFYAKERRIAQVARRLRPLFWLGRIVLPHEVHRLELALKRCGDLAVRQHTDGLYRDQLRRAYKNSRDSLLQQLQTEARSSALAKDPKVRQAEEKLRAEAAAAAKGLRSQEDAHAVGQLRAGMAILAAGNPEQHAHLARWFDRESELLDALVKTTKGEASLLTVVEREAALAAGRAGFLVSRERTVKPLEVPIPHQHLAPEIQRANARFIAAGVASPFSAEALAASHPKAVAKALEQLRGETTKSKSTRRDGFVDEGDAWALRASAAYPIAQKVRATLMPPKPKTEEIQR